MTLPADVRVTTEVLWRGALLFAAVDLLFVAILVWRARRVPFAELKRPLLSTTAVFWLGLWLWAVSTFWESVYGYVFPAWIRWWLPVLQAGLACLVAWALWWLACRAPGRPVLTFLLGGGVWGIVGHVIGILRGLVDKPPMLRGARPEAALTIAFFEFIFYWCVILTVALVLHRVSTRRAPAPAALSG
jgi:hypothetical protein